MATMTTAAHAMSGRRVVTAPVLQRKMTDPDEEEDTEKDIFDHPDAKVVSFDAPPALERPGTPKGQSKDGTLPWTSRFETFHHRGRLRLYQPKTEQTMLASGNNSWQLVMMPRTNCWCVDKQSKFAIKVGLKIYRIELPWETEEDKAKVEEFKKALDSVIMLEKKECPFKRGYETEGIVEAVDSPKTRSRLIGKNKLYKLSEQPTARRPSTPATDGSPDGSVQGSDDDISGSRTPTGQVSPSRPTTSLLDGSRRSTGEEGTQRSVTAPVLLPPKIAPSRTPFQRANTDNEVQDTEGARSSSPSTQQKAAVATPRGRTSVSLAASPSSPEPAPVDALTPNDAAQSSQHQASNPPPSASSEDNDSNLDQPKSPVVTAKPEPISTSTSRSSLPRIYPADSPPRTPTRSKPDATAAAEELTVAAHSPTQSSSISPTSTTDDVHPITSRKTSSTPSTASSSIRATVPSTPPNQPPPKSRSTTRASTTQISSPSKFRNSSLVSDDDDIPSIGVFSQALNILRGPPSGLIAVLMGFARRASNMGFTSNGAGGLGLGLSRSHSGSSDRPGHQRRKSDMPGTWRFDGAAENSEDEGDLEDESEEDDFGVPLHNGKKGRNARQRWGSPTGVDSSSEARHASNAGSSTAPTSRQRTGPNEWTDSDLD